MIDMDKFVKERDKALLSLDKKKIERYMKKYQVHWKPSDETAFWAGIHKAILQLQSATPEQKMRSGEWLDNHGFSREIT